MWKGRWRGAIPDPPMKQVLIVSPSFPPVNAADMHRVRLSVPWFSEFGWRPTILMVDPRLNEAFQDPLLLESIPRETEVHRVKALSPRLTRKVGLGSLALRALPYLRRAGDRLLRGRKFDLVYFSTTMFPVMILGASWKRRFRVPYVLDMQDPWHDDYHLHRPKAERPKKFWFSYRLHKFLEPRAMRTVDGIISVSDTYTKTLQERYANIRPEMCQTIPFGASSTDLEVLDRVPLKNDVFDSDDGLIHIVNTGNAGGHTMRFAFAVIFNALRLGLAANPSLFRRLRLHFIGTTYAPHGTGENAVMPVAEECGVADYVDERPSRLPYFEALKVLTDADMLLIPGVDDPGYTASKLFPYIITRKPILSVVHEQSSVVGILKKTCGGECIPFNSKMNMDQLAGETLRVWSRMLDRLPAAPDTDWEAFEPYTAREMTRRQVESFERAVLAHGN